MNESSNDHPTKTDFAKASRGAYSMVGKGNLAQRLEATKKNGMGEGWDVHPSYTDRNVTTYHNRVKNQFVIAHRGTSLKGPETKKDLLADWGVMTGKKNIEMFKKRKAKTEKILKSIGPEGKVYLTGHSVGGASINSVLLTSAKTRSRIEQAHTFNPGTSVLGAKQHNSKIKKELDTKLTHHKIQGDSISESSVGLGGRVKTNKSTKSPSIGMKIIKHIQPMLDHPALQLVGKGVEHVAGVLQNHSIDNFT
jgi:hypothetical protein